MLGNLCFWTPGLWSMGGRDVIQTELVNRSWIYQRNNNKCTYLHWLIYRLVDTLVTAKATAFLVCFGITLDTPDLALSRWYEKQLHIFYPLWLFNRHLDVLRPTWSR